MVSLAASSRPASKTWDRFNWSKSILLFKESLLLVWKQNERHGEAHAAGFAITTFFISISGMSPSRSASIDPLLRGLCTFLREQMGISHLLVSSSVEVSSSSTAGRGVLSGALVWNFLRNFRAAAISQRHLCCGPSSTIAGNWYTGRSVMVSNKSCKRFNTRACVGVGWSCLVLWREESLSPPLWSWTSSKKFWFLPCRYALLLR